MNNFSLSNSLLILGIILLFIAIIGQSRLGFIEINPGFFGRFLALIIGLLSLAFAGLLVLFPVEMIDLLKNYIAQFLQQNLGLIH